MLDEADSYSKGEVSDVSYSHDCKERKSPARGHRRRSPSRGSCPTSGPEFEAEGALPLWNSSSIIVVMGVSGCGKSTVASMLAQRLNWVYEDGDWFHPPSNIRKMHNGEPLTDDDRWPWLHGI